MTGLLKLLGALECLPLDQIESLPVHQVKELSQQLFKGTKKLAEIEFKPGREYLTHKKREERAKLKMSTTTPLKVVDNSSEVVDRPKVVDQPPMSTTASLPENKMSTTASKLCREKIKDTLSIRLPNRYACNTLNKSAPTKPLLFLARSLETSGGDCRLVSGLPGGNKKTSNLKQGDKNHWPRRITRAWARFSRLSIALIFAGIQTGEE
ncbi:17947_t:CDS:2 [Funneliformis geosporum]|uniref:17947_t:CDS:1 n=1 Tax=Funneliformis geosporum TaxID=1117311 RepID=A0A9W4X711_9GLOM|nr:17947_t:CDS:2 [Funneliformis geosporum]